MKISRGMENLFNNQIAMEASASNYYLSMASWSEVTGYEGAASFLYQQADEERQHMLKIVHYMNNLGVQAKIPSIKEPTSNFNSLESVFKAALKSEQSVTQAINKMVDVAQKEKDHSSYTFLQWFVTEQVQEETKFETILQKFDLIGRDKIAINEIDRQLGAMATQATNAA
ncbi:ferritin [Candidatus Nitrosotenuis uzonensis]|nr:ferritin [Candidatus Nitrosotenuis uzonensis]